MAGCGYSGSRREDNVKLTSVRARWDVFETNNFVDAVADLTVCPDSL